MTSNERRGLWLIRSAIAVLFLGVLACVYRAGTLPDWSILVFGVALLVTTLLHAHVSVVLRSKPPS